MTTFTVLLLFLSLATSLLCHALLIPSSTSAANIPKSIIQSSSSPQQQQEQKSSTLTTRNEFFRGTMAAIINTAVLVTATMNPTMASAADTESETRSKASLLLYTDDEIREIVQSDLVERQFLATGNITKSIYDPRATFTDEIDTYALEQWVKGTQRLFVGQESSVRLVGPVNVSREKIEFQFDENLMFNIPFRPIVTLTGTVILSRDPITGLIISYREYWDQDVVTVLKSAKF